MMPQHFDEEGVLLVRSNEVEEFILHNGENAFATEALEREKAELQLVSIHPLIPLSNTYYSQYAQTL